MQLSSILFAALIEGNVPFSVLLILILHSMTVI